MNEVFISYRRGDPDAELLHKWLERKLYRGAVFYDVQDLPGGEFRDNVVTTVKKARVLLILIGKVWELRAEDLQKDDDVVRLEIQTALDARIRIVPLNLTGKGPEALPLPKGLEEPLQQQNILTLMARNRAELKKQLPALLPIILPHLTEYWRRRAWWARFFALTGFALALFLIVGIGLLFWTGADAVVHRHLISRRAFHGPLVPEVRDMATFVKARPMALPQGAVADRDRKFMDTWLENLDRYVIAEGRGPAGEQPRLKLFVASYRFGDYYETFNAQIRLGNESFIVTEAYLFLKSNDGPPTLHRPVYRQMKVVWDAELVDRKFRPLEVRNPNPGEELVLVLVVFKKPGADWDGPEKLGLKLEVS